MQSLHCTHRDYTIVARVFEHPGLPTPWAGGCRSSPRRPHQPAPGTAGANGLLADLDNAQHASIAHGKWLVDQCLEASDSSSNR
jgi:hypothetical protein